jgi:hypothetical protein
MPTEEKLDDVGSGLEGSLKMWLFLFFFSVWVGKKYSSL